MSLTETERRSAAGAFWALLAAFCFSCNDMAVKFLSGDYPLYQVIFMRTAFGIVFLMAILVPISGGISVLKTRRIVPHVLRGFFVVLANLTFFLGLASMELAEAVAIFFISPLVITVFSVVFLGEMVGRNRWAAVIIGMIGVLVVLRPGTSAFQLAALLPIFAATMYASVHMLTRKIGGTENAVALAFYIQLTFLVVAGTASLLTFDGRFDTFDHPSLQFLFREWAWPNWRDLALMLMLGVTSSMGGFAISQAYRRSEAGFVAPFEYLAMPLAVFWGLTVFGEWPDVVAWLGIALILASGLVLIWREAVNARKQTLDAPNRL